MFNTCWDLIYAWWNGMYMYIGITVKQEQGLAEKMSLMIVNEHICSPKFILTF